MNKPAHLPPLSSALANYLVKNPQAAVRIAGMNPEDAAAALQRVERWIGAHTQNAPKQAQAAFDPLMPAVL